MSKVRIRHGDHEIELDGSDSFIEAQLHNFYDRLALAKAPQGPSIKEQLLEEAKPKPSSKALTPAEFYKKRKKTDGLSQLLIFAKYLEEVEGASDFTSGDVNRVASEAKLSKDVHPQYFTNAVRQGLLRKRGSKYSLTLSAEELLASM